MKRSVKISLTVASVMIGLGLVLGIIALCYCDFDFKRIATTDNSYHSDAVDTFDEPIVDIDINASICDISVVDFESDEPMIEYNVNDKINIDISVDNGVLKVTEKSNIKWYDGINISFGEEESFIKVWLPKKQFEKLSFITASGDIEIENAVFKDMQVKTASGDITVNRITGKNLELDTSSGEIELKNAENGDISIKTVSGDIDVSDIKGEKFSAHTTSGEIDFERLSVTLADIKSTSGDIEAEDFKCSGLTKIKTTSGNAEFDRSDSESFNIESVSGEINCGILSGKAYEVKTVSGIVNVPQSILGGGEFYVKTTSGDITVTEY